mmetsp:Transcript_7839/g.21156  ORF Transcript_7839/g.21156 Transcript_7839/m.21156 type:complete len:107 (-) Transcript_7839:49-369(-)
MDPNGGIAAPKIHPLVRDEHSTGVPTMLCHPSSVLVNGLLWSEPQILGCLLLLTDRCQRAENLHSGAVQSNWKAPINNSLARFFQSTPCKTIAELCSHATAEIPAS